MAGEVKKKILIVKAIGVIKFSFVAFVFIFDLFYIYAQNLYIQDSQIASQTEEGYEDYYADDGDVEIPPS